MIVSELIKELQKFDGEMEAVIYDRNYCEEFRITFITEGDIDGKQCVLIAFQEELNESKLF
jgi:hypothetical protein